MQVLFRSKRLAECAGSEREAVREWGPDVGPRYGQRVALLAQTARVEDLYAIASLRFHPLRGERQSQYSLTITGRWRLIVTLQDDKTIIIEEVSNHYDD